MDFTRQIFRKLQQIVSWVQRHLHTLERRRWRHWAAILYFSEHCYISKIMTEPNQRRSYRILWEECGVILKRYMWPNFFLHIWIGEELKRLENISNNFGPMKSFEKICHIAEAGRNEEIFWYRTELRDCPKAISNTYEGKTVEVSYIYYGWDVNLVFNEFVRVRLVVYVRTGHFSYV